MFGQKSTPAYTNEVNEVGRIVVEEECLRISGDPCKEKKL
jgi:hypothetical protein